MPHLTPHTEDVDLFREWNDKQLVAEVTQKAGAPGAGAAAEITRRLMDRLVESADESKKQTERLNRLTLWLLGLTFALLVLTVVTVFRG